MSLPPSPWMPAIPSVWSGVLTPVLKSNKLSQFNSTKSITRESHRHGEVADSILWSSSISTVSLGTKATRGCWLTQCYIHSWSIWHRNPSSSVLAGLKVFIKNAISLLLLLWCAGRHRGRAGEGGSLLLSQLPPPPSLGNSAQTCLLLLLLQPTAASCPYPLSTWTRR